MTDISNFPIKNFLEAVDDVLNSNTFLLWYTPIYLDDLKRELTTFLRSTEFYNQIINQDKERGWYNMHAFISETESYRPRSGDLVKQILDLKIENALLEKREYLIAMLTTDERVPKLSSPYRTQKDRVEAEKIVDDFAKAITQGNFWELYTVYPDFLVSAVERQAQESIWYFEGDYASDTATLIVTQDKHYLLLTNGIA